jgi:hypothetical protein
MVDFAVNPRKLALVNVDLQNVFVEGVPVSPPDGPAVLELLANWSTRISFLTCRPTGVTGYGWF